MSDLLCTYICEGVGVTEDWSEILFSGLFFERYCDVVKVSPRSLYNTVRVSCIPKFRG